VTIGGTENSRTCTPSCSHWPGPARLGFVATYPHT
jgi:hypothetical protein